MKNKEFSGAVFLLKKKSGASFILQARDMPTKRLLHYDGKRNRSLRYASNQDSFYIDEQDDNIILEPIIFEDGVLNCGPHQESLAKFLRVHPAFNNLYTEWDPAKDAEERINMENLILDAQIAARGLSLDKMQSVIRIFTEKNTDKMDVTEIKWECMRIAKNYPEEFMDAINDPELESEDIAARAIRDGFVSVRNGGRDIHYNEKDNKRRLMTVPIGEEPASALQAWLKSDDGLDFYKKLVNHYEA